MYRNIAVPVDLEHVDRLDKALSTAADLAKHYDATVCYIGVTTTEPSPLGHTPDEYAEQLATFGKEQAAKHGIKTATLPRVAHDMSVELDKVLLEGISECGADAVVMASHVPGLADHFFASNAGTVAADAKVSVFVIR